MTITLKGIVRYDGAPFAGWQVQPGRQTVQGELEGALSRIASEPVGVQGASRTDAGVHAFGQVFSCRWPKALPPRLRHAVSKMLSPEIRVVELDVAPDDFHARFSAHGKRYAYAFDLSREPDPFSARYAWHVPYRVDLELLASLLPALEGEHDFAGFQSTGTQMDSTVRRLRSVKLLPGGVIGPCDAPNLWRIEFQGDGFLYKMVRNLTGTLLEIARGRFPATFIKTALDSGGPFLGHCAPPHGLTLLEVFYGEASSES
jgi:tRNA pseudouridine38-40 synthase